MIIESTNDNNSTNPAITYSECYAQPFLLFNESNLDTMGRIPDNFIDLTVTSPPYDDLRTYNGYCFDFENVAKELFRITKQGGVVVWVVGDATVKGSETGNSFKQALFFMQCGFNLHDTMIYAKNSYMPHGGNRYEQQFEYMFILSKSAPNTCNKIRIPCITAGTKRYRGNEKKEAGMQARDIRTTVNDTKPLPNIWWYDVGKNDKTSHSAAFPEALANDHIISWSNEGDIVYDPFAGSGTTGKMAILNKRKCIMSEISSEYCDIIKKRLEPIINERTLF